MFSGDGKNGRSTKEVSVPSVIITAIGKLAVISLNHRIRHPADFPVANLQPFDGYTVHHQSVVATAPQLNKLPKMAIYQSNYSELKQDPQPVHVEGTVS